MNLLDWIGFMFSPWGLPFTFYCAMQAFAILWLRGGWRLAGLIPIPPMAYVVYVTDDAYRQHSNLWPMLLILASPVMFIFLAVLLFFQPKRPNAP